MLEYVKNILYISSDWGDHEVNIDKWGPIFSKRTRGNNKTFIKDLFNIKKINQDRKYLGTH